MNSHILSGKKAICNFVGRSWATVEDWILNKQFPAKLINGRWESDGVLITAWRQELLNGGKKPENVRKSNNNPTKRPRKLIRSPKTS